MASRLSFNEKVCAIYTSGNKTAINQATELLIKAMREGDEDSWLALRQFLGLPTIRRPTETDIDRVLISQVLMYINGANAIQVQTWLSSYEASPPYSQRRSRLESMLRAFVASNRQVEQMKYHFADFQSLITEMAAKCAELKSIQEDIHEMVRKLRHHHTKDSPPGR